MEEAGELVSIPCRGGEMGKRKEREGGSRTAVMRRSGRVD